MGKQQIDIRPMENTQENADINPILLITMFNVSGLNPPIRSQI